jgi:hypothetical protein
VDGLWFVVKRSVRQACLSSEVSVKRSVRQAKCPSSEASVKRSVRQAKCPSSLPVVPWQAGKATVKRSDRLPFAVHRLKKTTDIIEKDENLF